MSFLNSILRPFKREAVPNIRDEARMLADLIIMDDDWKKDQHIWYHPTGIAIWVGNLDLGISVKWNSMGRGDYVALYVEDAWKATKEEEVFLKQAMQGYSERIQKESIHIVAKRIVEKYKLVDLHQFSANPLLDSKEEFSVVVSKIQAIHRFIKSEGMYVETTSKSADRWEFKELSTLMTDGGYGLQISGPDFAAWADLGCNQHGLMRGSEEHLDQVIRELGITL